jgi:hypothetical protein
VAITLLNEDSNHNRELRERFAREAESVAIIRLWWCLAAISF